LLTYYTSAAKLDRTPGHQDKTGPGVRYEIFSADAAILRCFLCHSTGTPAVSKTGVIRPEEAGVRCETCHGPGVDHVAKPGKGNIVQPAAYSADELNRMCGSCHRMPAASGENTDYANPWNARHQPLYLAQSECFVRSRGKLSCLTCHSAHSGAARPACAGCHSSVRHPPAIKTAGVACETCHMPVVQPSAYLRFSNHWIGVYRRGENLIPLGR
jgi:hypothetical protein